MYIKKQNTNKNSILSSINSATTGICMIKTSKDRIRDVIFESHAFHFITHHTNYTLYSTLHCLS